MNEISAFSINPLTEVESTAIEFLNFARAEGVELRGLYIVGLFEDEDGRIQAESGYHDVDGADMARVVAQAMQDMVELTVSRLKVVADVTPETMERIEQAVRGVLQEQTEDEEDEA